MPEKPLPPPAHPPSPGQQPVAAGFWLKATQWIVPPGSGGGNYRDLFVQRWPDLCYCFLFIFISGYGQTFLLAIFQPHWREALGLSISAMGLLYSAGTLVSALFLPAAGRWMDRSSTERVTLTALIGLSAAALAGAFVFNVATLFLAIVLLRFFGQGFASNLGMARSALWFSQNRGKAISLANLGFPLGEAVMPLSVTLLIATVTWQGAWIFLLLLCPLVWAPLAFSLLRRAQARPSHQERLSPAGPAGPQPGVLRDWRFYAMLAISTPVPFIGTGVIFFQSAIAVERDWSPYVFPLGFILFAGSRALFSIIAGAWVDRVGSLRILPIPTVLVAGGLLALSHHSIAAAFFFFLMMGIGFGASSGVMMAAWTDLFGTWRIGYIRGLSGSVGVFATALAPFLFGLAFDSGLGIATILVGCASLMTFVALPVSAILARTPASAPPPPHAGPPSPGGE